VGKLVVRIAVIVTLLGGIAATQEHPRLSAATAMHEGIRQHSDAELIASHPNLMSRRGVVLEVQGQSFSDQGDCEVEDCTRYRADSVWKEEYVGIQVSYYEESDYYIVDRKDVLPIGSKPIPSPSGKRFFTGHQDDRGWSPYQGASVWEWEPRPRRLRIVDTDLVEFYSFVSWRGDKCVEFTGARGYNVDSRPEQTFWLAEQHGDWQLLEERPAICPNDES
jgi:co-chaperonin GroES (HSP10)